MSPDDLKRLLSENQSDCVKVLSKVQYEPKGITNFEGLCLWSLIGFYKPDVLIESGVSKARSTAILCEAAKQFSVESVYAFDKSPDFEEYVRQKLAKYAATTYEVGDSSDKIIALLPTLKNKKVGVFIDGPKLGKAYARLMECVAQIPSLQFVVSHDCYIGSPTRDSFAAGYSKYFKKRYEMYFTDPTFCKDKSVNESVRAEMAQKIPEKLPTLEDHCYRIGVITRR